jgi:hypothetical protein
LIGQCLTSMKKIQIRKKLKVDRPNAFSGGASRETLPLPYYICKKKTITQLQLPSMLILGIQKAEHYKFLITAQ